MIENNHDKKTVKEDLILPLSSITERVLPSKNGLHTCTAVYLILLAPYQKSSINGRWTVNLHVTFV